MKLRVFLLALLLIALSGIASAQCGNLVPNPITGVMDCAGGSGGSGNVSANVINIKSAPYNASGFVYSTNSVGSASSGSTSITVVDASGFTLNQIIVIPRVGSGNLSSSIYTGAITGIASNVISLGSATGATIPANSPVYTVGTTTTIGTTVAGTSVTVAESASFSAGQGILIPGAGAAGANYVGTIVTAGTTMTVTPATSTSVSSGTLFQHDDTTAIQTALNACGTPPGCNITFPDGIYRINGPTQQRGSTGYYAFLLLPDIPENSTSMAEITITMQGVNPVGRAGSLSGAILQTEHTSTDFTAGGQPMFGVYSAGASVSHYSAIMWTVKNLLFRGPPAPEVTWLDGSNAYGVDWDYITIDDTFPNIGCTPQCLNPPTYSSGSGLITPLTASTGFVYVDHVAVQGYY